MFLFHKSRIKHVKKIRLTTGSVNRELFTNTSFHLFFVPFTGLKTFRRGFISFVPPKFQSSSEIVTVFKLKANGLQEESDLIIKISKILLSLLFLKRAQANLYDLRVKHLTIHNCLQPRHLFYSNKKDMLMKFFEQEEVEIVREPLLAILARVLESFWPRLAEGTAEFVITMRCIVTGLIMFAFDTRAQGRVVHALWTVTCTEDLQGVSAHALTSAHARS